MYAITFSAGSLTSGSLGFPCTMHIRIFLAAEAYWHSRLIHIEAQNSNFYQQSVYCDRSLLLSLFPPTEWVHDFVRFVSRHKVGGVWLVVPAFLSESESISVIIPLPYLLVDCLPLLSVHRTVEHCEIGLECVDSRKSGMMAVVGCVLPFCHLIFPAHSLHLQEGNQRSVATHQRRVRDRAVLSRFWNGVVMMIESWTKIGRWESQNICTFDRVGRERLRFHLTAGSLSRRSGENGRTEQGEHTETAGREPQLGGLIRGWTSKRAGPAPYDLGSETDKKADPCHAELGFNKPYDHLLRTHLMSSFNKPRISRSDAAFSMQMPLHCSRIKVHALVRVRLNQLQL